jgi:hypothetical protein
MQCANCNIYVSDSTLTCPRCSLPIRITPALPKSSPLPLDRRSLLRRDITPLIWVFLCTPLLALSVLPCWDIVGDVPKMAGEAAAPGLIAAGIAWLLSRIGKYRFRVTMVMAYSVLVGLLLLSHVSPTPTNNAPTESQAAYEIHWPAGWKVSAQSTSPDVFINGQEVVAIKGGGGAPDAVMELLVGERNGLDQNLKDDLRRMLNEAGQQAEQSGAEFSSSQPVLGTIGGRPSLEVLSEMKINGVVVQERMAVTYGERYVCSLVFSSRELEKFQNEFLATRDSLTCH